MAHSKIVLSGDIANILSSVAVASDDVVIVGGTQREQDELRKAYDAGRKKILVAMALAFGLEPVGSVVQVEQGYQEQVNQGQVALLWAESPQER